MSIRGLLLDVEGVLVADKRYTAVDSAVEFIRRARRANCPLRLITNNTTDNKDAIIDKLTRAGFDFTLNELHTCTGAAVAKLREMNTRRCLVLGNNALQEIIRAAGVDVVDSAEVDAVVVGLDTELSYDRLRTACDAVATHKAALIALHHNRLYPDSAGRASPSVGALVAAIEYATQAESIVMGKPSEAYYRQVLDDIRLSAADVLLVSDDPFSDLAGAKRMGMSAVLVLSGKYHEASIVESIPPDQRPDLIVPRIGDLSEADSLSLGF